MKALHFVIGFEKQGSFYARLSHNYSESAGFDRFVIRKDYWGFCTICIRAFMNDVIPFPHDHEAEALERFENDVPGRIDGKLHTAMLVSAI